MPIWTPGAVYEFAGGRAQALTLLFGLTGTEADEESFDLPPEAGIGTRYKETSLSVWDIEKAAMLPVAASLVSVLPHIGELGDPERGTRFFVKTFTRNINGTGWVPPILPQVVIPRVDLQLKCPAEVRTISEVMADVKPWWEPHRLVLPRTNLVLLPRRDQNGNFRTVWLAWGWRGRFFLALNRKRFMK